MRRFGPSSSITCVFGAGSMRVVMDVLSRAARSAVMARVRAKDTAPELAARRLLHSMGYRYRLHRRDLPGNPDIVFPSRRKVIFVHGCFWHRHARCPNTRMPKSRVAFWRTKFEGNRRRDLRTARTLTALGWRSFTIWECELVGTRVLRGRLRRFLDRGVRSIRPPGHRAPKDVTGPEMRAQRSKSPRGLER